MQTENVEKLSNELRKIASRKTKQIEELDQLEKQVINNTINWTGDARAKKMEQEKNIATIENTEEIKRMLKTFDKNLEKEGHKILIENIKSVTLLEETKELASQLNITLSDTNELLTEQAKVSDSNLLLSRTDTFSKLVLHKCYTLGLLTGNDEQKVRRLFTDSQNMNAITELQTARDFIFHNETRKPEEFKQINFEGLLERTLSAIG